MKILNSVKDTRHTKTELRRIFVDSENMVATDGRGIVVKPLSKFAIPSYKTCTTSSHTVIKQPSTVAIPNLYLLNQRERRESTNSDLVWWDNKPAIFEKKVGEYPKYKRLISNAPPVSIDIKGLDNVILYLKNTLQLNFYEDEYKKLIKACKGLTFTSYSYNGGSVTLYSPHYIIIIAPVFY